MGRANQLISGGGILHVTHRCHNRAFLLRFACDRDADRAMLIDAEDRLEVSGLMRNVVGEFARAYNRRKKRMNAFWGDNVHATLIEAGRYLWRCLCYVELNMVRCGVVRHPKQWEWVGYHEVMGSRRRYRLLDLERLCWRLGTGDLQEVRSHLEAALEEAIPK